MTNAKNKICTLIDTMFTNHAIYNIDSDIASDNIDSTNSSSNTNSKNTIQGIGQRSLFVVGDDAQSIYGFRGSKIEIILGFQKHYSNTKEIILNQNYRSTQPILDLAEKILTHNPKQKKKLLFTDNPSITQVNYKVAYNEREEAEFILKQIYQIYVEDNEETNRDSENTSQLSSDPKNTSKTSKDPIKESIKAQFTLDKLQLI